MVSLSQSAKDEIYNALIVGMAPEDAYLFAGLTADQISWIGEDEDMQNWIRQTQKLLEYNLLTYVKDGAKFQSSIGKTDAAQWMLEKLYPRYSAKAAPDTGTINLVFKSEDVEDIVNVVGEAYVDRATEASISDD